MDSQVFCVEPGSGGEPQPIAIPELDVGQHAAKQWGASMAISNGWIAIGAPDSDTQTPVDGPSGKLTDAGRVYLFKRSAPTGCEMTFAGVIYGTQKVRLWAAVWP